MGESRSSAPPQLEGLTIEAVEWLPSGADSGLVRVRGRWSSVDAVRAGLPELVLRAGGVEHRFESLPDARFARDPASWRGSYLVPVALVTGEHEALWVQWPDGARSGLPPLAPGLAPPLSVPPAPPAVESEPEGGQLIDQAVLAERRARRAEAAEQTQARVAAEALRAVEALELQSAELERRLAEATAERDALAAAAAAESTVTAPPAEEVSAPASGVVGELEQLAERRRAALAGALDSLARLRAQSREWRLRLRTSEIAHAGDAVRLAVLESERATGAQATREALHQRVRELEAERLSGEQRAAELAEATEAAARARTELEELRGEFEVRLSEARAEAERSRAELAQARDEAEARLTAALAAAEAAAEEVERRRRGEHAVHEEVREALRERLDATAARLVALEAAQAELVTARGTADTRSVELRARVTELEAALAATETSLHTATAAAATHETRLRVESVARAALEDELDRDRAARAGLAADLEAERAARSVEAAEREAANAQRATLALERGALVAERDSFAADLASARAARDAALAERDGLRAELEAERAARAAADEAAVLSRREGGALQDRIAELDARAAGLAAEVRLEQAAREQAEAAAAAARRPEAESGRMVADLDAAAAALRQPAEVVEPVEVAEPAVVAEPAEAVEPAAVAEPAEAVEPAAVAEPAEVVAPAEVAEPVAAEVVPAAVAPARVRPRIVSATGPPARLDAIGRSKRQYPELRGAIVKLAHDDPETAGRLIAALLPAQAAALANALDYDLTIREVGTFAVTVAGTWTHVKPLAAPRPRGQSDFHLKADALTLAELLAGVNRRVGRLFGAARFSGRRRRLNVLRALPATRLTLADASRAGANLDPGLVYTALSYAVHPSWTKGERFTIAQEIDGEPPETWYLTARNGAGLAVSAQSPPEPPEATVSMSRETFDLLLRGEPVPRGSRPCVRGDRHVVARMKAWTERAQGLPGA